MFGCDLASAGVHSSSPVGRPILTPLQTRVKISPKLCPRGYLKTILEDVREAGFVIRELFEELANRQGGFGFHAPQPARPAPYVNGIVHD